MGIECGCSMPSMTSASATWSGSSVLSWRLSCSRLSRMSSRRRSPPRLSDSPGCNIADSLLCDDLDEPGAHFVGTFELKPVSGAIENFQPVVPRHVSRGALSLQTTKGGILVAPHQHSGCADLDIPRKGRPSAAPCE